MLDYDVAIVVQLNARAVVPAVLTQRAFALVLAFDVRLAGVVDVQSSCIVGHGIKILTHECACIVVVCHVGSFQM